MEIKVKARSDCVRMSEAKNTGIVLESFKVIPFYGTDTTKGELISKNFLSASPNTDDIDSFTDMAAHLTTR